MSNSNQTRLLDEIETTSIYQPITPVQKTMLQPTSPYMQYDTKDSYEFVIESGYQLYKYLTYLYLIINGFQFIRSAVDIYTNGFSAKRILPMAFYIVSFSVWLFGKIAFNYRNPKYQLRFQGLLIALMIYHLLLCLDIIVESYDALPNVTISAFGLNSIFGVAIPVFMYFRANNLRIIFEMRSQVGYIKG